jgi:hypothetical protein
MSDKKDTQGQTNQKTASPSTQAGKQEPIVKPAKKLGEPIVKP